jgi:hypothetical protein
MSREQLYAEFFLKETDSGRDIGLDHIEYGGRPIHAAASRYGIHDPQVIDVHRSIALSIKYRDGSLRRAPSDLMLFSTPDWKMSSFVEIGHALP